MLIVDAGVAMMALGLQSKREITRTGRADSEADGLAQDGGVPGKTA